MSWEHKNLKWTFCFKSKSFDSILKLLNVFEEEDDELGEPMFIGKFKMSIELLLIAAVFPLSSVGCWPFIEPELFE